MHPAHTGGLAADIGILDPCLRDAGKAMLLRATNVERKSFQKEEK
jgi:hypothetical protein